MGKAKTKGKRKEYGLIKRVANNIKKYRMIAEMSQEQLWMKTGLIISRCESGEHDMTLTTIGILSKHLNIEPYELLK